MNIREWIKMEREICHYEFDAIICGIGRVIEGTGAGLFEGTKDAIIQVVRKEGVKYQDIRIVKTVKEVRTGQWI